MAKEFATLGGGCFWCLEAIFSELNGITKVVPGYAGGYIPNPSYELVCTGRTGHAEVVQITFDPDTITYEDILNVFFTTHDPTTINRQGADVGTQYRSTILYHTPEQQTTAERVIADIEAADLWDDPIVTDVEPLHEFFPAEDYHKGYFARNTNQVYCQIVIAPKVAKFRHEHMEKLR